MRVVEAAVVIGAGLILACHKEPVPWQALPEDTLAVVDLISEEEYCFPVQFLFESNPDSFDFPYEWVPFHDTLQLRFFPRAFQRKGLKVIKADTQLFFAPDTSCTALVWLQFRGELEVRCDSVTPKVQDSIYADYFVAKDTVIAKPLHGELFQRFLFRKSAQGWERAGVSGGVEVSSPEVAWAPRLNYLVLKLGERSDTIWPDTAHYGLRRFYQPDSFISASGRWLEVLGYDPADSLICFLWADSLRYDLKPISLPEGDHWFSFEVVPYRVFVYPDGEHRSLRWVIPVRILRG
jgi:hypothetical protein